MNIATGLKKVRQSIATFSLVAMVMSMLVTSGVANAAFADVPSDAWYKATLDQAVELGIMDGTQTNARPGDYATRSEAIKVLVEAAGITKDGSGTQACPDVPNNGRWDYVYWQTALANGIASGYANGNCGGLDPVTRGQFAKLAVNAFSYVEKTTPSAPNFSDVDLQNVFYKFIESAYYWSMVEGYADGTFGWMKNINRAELFTMTIRGLNPVAREQAGNMFKVASANPTSATQVELMFAMDVDATTGAMAANYSIKDNDNNTLPVTSAVVSGNKVMLTTGSQTVNKTYKVTVTGVTSSTGKALEGTNANMATFAGYNAVGTGGELTVGLASETPALTTLVTKTANNNLLALSLTAGSSKASQVTGVTLKKLGFYNDSSVKVVAYDSNNVRISSGVTFSDGMASVTFTTPVVVPAGQTVKVWFKVSISGTSAGTLGVSVDKKEDIAANSTQIMGTFPMMTPVHNVVDGSPSVAAATVDVSTIAATSRTVDIGEKNFELTKFDIAETSSKEDLQVKGITFFNNGSTADGDLKNFVLKDQTGKVLATAADQKNKLVTFDLGQTPYVLPKGSSRAFSVFVDVVNGATRTGQLIIQNDFDVWLRGASTSADVLATAQSGGTDTSFPSGDVTTTLNAITINEGTLTVSKANTSPSGDVTIGSSDVVLGSFEVKAAGEDIELQRVKIDLSSEDTTPEITTQNTTGIMECTTAQGCDLTGSIKLMVDEDLDGKGDKTLLTTSAAPSTLGDLWDADALANYDLSSFYTVVAGKTVNLLIIGNVSSTTEDVGAGETIKVGLTEVYHYKKSSLKYDTEPESGVVLANQMTVTTSSLTVSKDTSYGDQTLVSQSGAKLGSFVVKAGSAEGVNITSLSIKGGETCGGAADVSGYTNVRLMKVVPAVGNTPASLVQLGSTKASVTFDGGGSGDTPNTYSVSGFQIAAGQQSVVEVYGDMNTDADPLCLTIPTSGISGTGLNSQTTVSAPSAAVNLQLITATDSGTLTVSVANDTPVSRQYVAGTVDNQVLLVRLASSNAEDIYIKKLQFRVDNTADDVAIKEASLRVGTAVNALTQTGSTLGWQEDGSNPGFVEWTFTGTSRPKVAKNGILYAGLYVNFTSSSQQTVSGKTPQFVLTNVEAEGLATLSATAGGDDVLITSGIVPAVGGTADANKSFVDSGANTLTTALSGTTETTLVTSGETFETGDVIFIDEDDSNDWDPATEELMVVVDDGGTDLEVIRGAFGTTAQSAYTTGNDIFVLNTGGLDGFTNNLVGNNNETFNSKPTFTVATDTPKGATTGGTNKVLFKFNVAAAYNTADGSENKVVLNYIDITTSKSGVTVNNLALYPADFDNNTTYKTTCVALDADEWRCTLDTSGATNEVIENTTKGFIVRADIGSSTNENNTLETYIANLGSIASAGDVNWDDDYGTEADWVYQPGSTEIKATEAMTLGASSGTYDETAPTISAITITDATANDILAVGDLITVTFSERMDPTTIGPATMVPGGAAVAVTDAATGDITIVDTGAADVIRLVNIIDVSVGNDNFAEGAQDATGATTAALDSTGSILTLTVTNAISGEADDGTEVVRAGSASTSMEDANGTAATADGSDSATVNGDNI